MTETATRLHAQPMTDVGGEGEGAVSTSQAAVVDRDWLRRFASATRTVTLASLTTVNSCIFTTRVGLAVLERVGVAARPAAVYVTAHNREAWYHSQDGVPVAQWPASAHSVGITEQTGTISPNGWNGHLVVMVRQPDHPRLLIDLTADQFDRPIRNLTVGGPVLMDIPTDKPWTPQDPLFTTVGNGPDAVVSYRPMPPGNPEAQRWQTTRDWNLPQDLLDTYVRHILDTM